MNLFDNAIFYYEGCKTEKRRKQFQKQNEKWRDGGRTLSNEKNDNFLSFCLFGVNGQKNLRYQKKGCHITLPLV
jgi:hypothetical protein